MSWFRAFCVVQLAVRLLTSALFADGCAGIVLLSHRDLDSNHVEPQSGTKIVGKFIEARGVMTRHMTDVGRAATFESANSTPPFCESGGVIGTLATGNGNLVPGDPETTALTKHDLLMGASAPPSSWDDGLVVGDFANRQGVLWPRRLAHQGTQSVARQSWPGLVQEPVEKPVRELTIMSFNIWTGGNNPLQLPPDKLVEVMIAGKADIIGVQERRGTTPALAQALGYNYALMAESESTSILSRYPIVATFADGVTVQLSPNQFAHVFNVHFSPRRYQPYDIHDGLVTSESQAIKAAIEARWEQFSKVRQQISPLLSRGEPVFLLGDFNEPSHLDWTPAAAEASLCAMKVQWPVSTALFELGMIDAYRTIHPDPVTHPGHTWTPYPQYKRDEDTVHDRIDFIYAAGHGVEVRSVRLVGETLEKADLVVTPFPSDHRAVVATMTLFESPPSAIDQIRSTEP